MDSAFEAAKRLGDEVSLESHCDSWQCAAGLLAITPSAAHRVPRRAQYAGVARGPGPPSGGPARPGL
eukprot:11715985-Alexandrium_andersonii.AAC.1